VTARYAATAAALLALLFARFDRDAAAAEARMRVLVVIDESDDLFAERIKAEVSALGLEVVAIEPWRTGESIESLDAAGRANQAAAAIRMIPSRKGVEVWMANQPTGRSLLRQLVVDERAGAPNEGLVALQTAELLRTTLLSRSEAPTATVTAARAATPTLPPAIAAPRPPSISNAGLQAAIGAMFSPGNGDPAIQVWLTVNRKIIGPVGIALDVSAPLRPSTISGPEGSADVGAWLAGAALFVRYERPETGLYALAAAGAAGLRLEAKGIAASSFVASSQSTTAGAAYLRADGGFEAAYWLRFGLRAIAGVVPSGVPVHFAGNEAAVWGRPFIATLLLADVAWR
jgi:hypothetical protein